MGRRRVIYRKSETSLPLWLDDLIFNKFGASWSPFPEEAGHNLFSHESRVREYLGTYIPKSYGEAFRIADNLFQNETVRSSLSREINILDIGCGTGGDILGLLSAMDRYLTRSAAISVYACDGNSTALRYMNQAVSAFAERSHQSVSSCIMSQGEIQSRDSPYGTPGQEGALRLHPLLQDVRRALVRRSFRNSVSPCG